MKKISDETGNALLEGIVFAAFSFGLVLSSGLTLFQVEADQLALNGLARNVSRDYLMNSSVPINEVLQKWQSVCSNWKDRELELKVICGGECTTGAILHIELSSAGLTASSFGVVDG